MVGVMFLCETTSGGNHPNLAKSLWPRSLDRKTSADPLTSRDFLKTREDETFILSAVLQARSEPLKATNS
jgi:hypothetical protein